MTWLLSLLGPLGDFLLKLLNGYRSPQVIEAEKAGALGQALKESEEHNVEVTTSAAAASGVANATATADGLRQYESHDENNRDNDGADSGR